jgi:hypothetical protein
MMPFKKVPDLTPASSTSSGRYSSNRFLLLDSEELDSFCFS